jgi:UDP-4-amino-4-deoxy-L-arabinose-oxoglutarate aminotransferase
MEKVEFFKHNIDEEDIARVNEVLRSVFLTNASVTKTFEARFGEYLGAKHVVAVNSCTAALHLALLALDIGEGDEVITTPMSFVATANSILHAGATPVFVDIEADTGNIDAALIEAAITPKTKAIMPVHLYGSMCDMKKIKEIADKYDLKIIEDCAHCIEGERDGVRPGQLSDAACFSFYATKNITSGEGGAVSCNDTALAERLYKLRLHGINKDAASRYTGVYKHWDMEILGWKYNISDIQSALLIGQLAKIDERLALRDKLVQFYEGELDKRGVEYVKIPKGTTSARHLFVIKTDKRDEMLTYLQHNGIGVAVNYLPIHLNGFYRHNMGLKEGMYPVAEQFGETCISLPLYPKLEVESVLFICKTISKFVTD